MNTKDLVSLGKSRTHAINCKQNMPRKREVTVNW